MSDKLFVNINVKDNIFGDIKVLKAAFISLEDRIGKIEGTSKKSFETLNKQVSKISLSSVIQNFTNLSDALGSISAPGLKFNASLQDLSALTGVTGKELQQLGEYARESAVKFGGEASTSLETYKTILSRLGPDIAKNKEALSGMEQNVQILSKTMGGDAAGAVDALTTAMLQYGVDLSKPQEAQKEMARMMDIMANAAQEGAAEVPQISAALKVSGVAATQAKVSFAEANSAIQALAQGGKEGSEAGMALRNILGKMAGEDVIPKEAAEKLKRLGVDMNIVSDKTIPFTQRLRELKKAQGDATIMAQVFGVENAAAANILLSTVDAQDELTVAIQKQGGAQEQANVVMESKEEKLKRMKAVIDDYKVSMFELTGGITAYMQPMGELLRDVTSLTPLWDMASGSMKLFKKETYANIASTKAWSVVTKVATVAQKILSTTILGTPIGWVIAGVATLSAGIYALVKSTNEQTAAQRINNEVHSRVIEKTSQEQAELLGLFTVLKQTNKGTAERKKIVSELNAKYPDLLAKYDLEKAGLNEINKAYKEIIRSIERKAEVEALQEMLTEKTKEIKTKAKEGRGVLQTQESYVLDLYKAKAEKAAILKELADFKVDDLKKESKLKSKTNELTVDDETTNEPVISGLDPKAPKAPKDISTSASGTSTTVDKRNITVKIDKLVENLSVNTTNLKEGIGEIKKQVTQALVGAVRDFELAM